MIAAIQPDSARSDSTAVGDSSGNTVVRLKSPDLFQRGREVEIEHEGRIYRSRLTQLNKLILNA